MESKGALSCLDNDLSWHRHGRTVAPARVEHDGHSGKPIALAWDRREGGSGRGGTSGSVLVSVRVCSMTGEVTINAGFGGFDRVLESILEGDEFRPSDESFCIVYGDVG